MNNIDNEHKKDNLSRYSLQSCFIRACIGPLVAFCLLLVFGNYFFVNSDSFGLSDTQSDTVFVWAFNLVPMIILGLWIIAMWRYSRLANRPINKKMLLCWKIVVGIYIGYYVFWVIATALLMLYLWVVFSLMGAVP